MKQNKKNNPKAVAAYEKRLRFMLLEQPTIMNSAFSDDPADLEKAKQITRERIALLEDKMKEKQQR